MKNHCVSRKVLNGTLALFLSASTLTAKASEALINQVENLRDTTLSSEKAQLRALTVKLANLHFTEALNQSSLPEQTSGTQAKVLSHRQRAISLFEGFLVGENGRYEAPTGEQKASSMFNLARLYADTDNINKAKTIWQKLCQNKDYPSIASESSLNLAELLEASDPASKEALKHFQVVMELDKRQDMRNYAHYRAAWIEKNLGKWNEAIADLKEALYDGKGQMKEEVIRDLINFHTESPLAAEQSITYFQDISAKTGRSDLLGKLADSYLATGKKPQAVKALQFVTAVDKDLIHSVRLLEESYGLRDWASYNKAADAIKRGQLDSISKDKQAEALKILKRLVVQLDAEKQTQADLGPYFMTAADIFVKFFPADEDVFKVASNMVFMEPTDNGKASRIRGFLDDQKLNISAKNKLVLQEQLVSIYQKLGKHDEASTTAKSLAAASTGADNRRFNFVHASELKDAGKDKEALEIFQDLVKQNSLDDIALKSQMLAVKILGKSGQYKEVLVSTEKYLEATKSSSNITGTKEYKAILEVKDSSEFEYAVLLGANEEALKSFLKFCLKGQFLPKSCENTNSIAVKIGDYDTVIAVMRHEKKDSDIAQTLESSGRFEDAAKELEKKIPAKNRSVTDFLHIAILFEIAGVETQKNRVLGDLVKFLSGKSFSSEGEEALVYKTLQDSSMLGTATASNLKWSEGHKCSLLNQQVAGGETSAKTIEALLSCKTSPGAAWTEQATLRIQKLNEAQLKVGFYGNNSKANFQKRLKAVNALAKEVDRLMPAADSSTFMSLARVAQDAFVTLAKEIESTPIPAEVTEDMLPQIKQSMAEMSQPFKEKANVYSGFIAKEESIEKSKAVAVAAESKPVQPVSFGEISDQVAQLKKDPTNKVALGNIRDVFSKKGNTRVVAYFDGRIKQSEVH